MFVRCVYLCVCSDLHHRGHWPGVKHHLLAEGNTRGRQLSTKPKRAVAVSSFLFVVQTACASYTDKSRPSAFAWRAREHDKSRPSAFAWRAREHDIAIAIDPFAFERGPPTRLIQH
jgi:hypothetical protein